MSRPKRRIRSLGCALLLGVGLAACHRGGPAKPVPDPPKTTVLVANGDFLDVVVYVVQRGQSVRLGTATSNRTTTFVIPPHILFGATPLSFRVDPIGARSRPSTGEVVIDPGDEIELRLSGGRIVLTKR
jgi:hypothetical protein